MENHMRVEFAFDEGLIEGQGYTVNDVYFTIKKLFSSFDLPCVYEKEMLIFQDKGRKNDFSHMWIVIMGLTRSKWFMESVKACFWCEGDYKREDVLWSARKHQRKEGLDERKSRGWNLQKADYI